MQKIKWADPMTEEVLVSTEVIMTSEIYDNTNGDFSGVNPNDGTDEWA